MSVDLGFWNGIAERYAALPVRDEDAYARTLDRVAHYLTPEQDVLELGAGTGTTAVKLAGQVKSITATDLAPAMLAIADQRAAEAAVDNLTTQVAVAQDAPEGPFDVILAMNLLHLLPDLTADLAAIAARLPDGGLFISKTPSLGEARVIKRMIMTAMVSVMQWVGKAPKTVSFLTTATLEQMIQDAGFEVVEVGDYPVSTPGRFVVARKISSVD
ncbi:class I SAM-dependent methyltransferase [Epibacterium ulvae]|uniref:class I SAM-dependent methyltransferase n=1 Tax=Epibacterium ulvae TaxID=1156985 RepID=UPI001BFCC1BD|nr:class I SAM-dependent methyltransferase [Epibacterium ulvae]MBT8155374.1 class I SAM-dependent methyltransferase [Epibacterium ulvae]